VRVWATLTAVILISASCTAPAHAQQFKRNAKADVDAIGTRKVAHGPNFYSIEREVELGRKLAAEFDPSVNFIEDPVVTEYINQIGQNLVHHSDAQIPFTIKVVDSDEVNAFSLPGGFFYVDSGLILFADQESELAAIMAHEIAHVCARHYTRVATRNKIAELVTVPLVLLGPSGWAGYALYGALRVGLPLTMLKFSRAAESEADFLGVQYLYEAGYDPNAVVTFLERVASDRKPAGVLSRMLSTHPQTRSRILAAQKEITTILPPRSEYIVTTSQFESVKERLQSRRSNEGKPPGDPTRPVIRDRTDRGTTPRE